MKSSPAFIWFKKKLPIIFITIGSLMLANVLWPIISYHLFVSPRIQKTDLITPINIQDTAFFAPPESLQANQSSDPTTPSVAGATTEENVDYTKASNWFPGQDFAGTSESKITHYTISIPKVDVEDAVVSIGGEDLSESLIQYPGTANPGQLGAPVVFGHSVLRQFYNPSTTNQDRYISIFSKIMTLESGDEIFVDYDGISYKYVVRDKFEVKPTDVFILRQRYDSRYLKLVTCVPEGTYLRRGIIEAQLVDISQDQSPRTI